MIAIIYLFAVVVGILVDIETDRPLLGVIAGIVMFMIGKCVLNM